ncbi:MAG: copper oxidase, partial [Gemmataceae bacterium]|nr:copper oxidase [Gemmataceae bacterium]
EMDTGDTRRGFLAAGTAAAAIVAASAGEAGAAGPPTLPEKPGHDHGGHGGHKDYPRTRAGAGGPVGSATDRGKLVPGLRAASAPPVPVEVPDSLKLPWKMVKGVKEFHLHAKHTRREFLPGAFMDVWGYNGHMPGPAIEAVAGDRVRIVVHNELPESTTLHLHGLELPNRMDGVPGLTQDPIKPGTSFAYELDLHQDGTYFYHSHGPMQEGMGMAGLFIIHPKKAYQPVVDHDFALLIQEWAILPNATIPNTASMEFNWFTINGRSAPYITPLLVKLGTRVRIRMVNMSVIDHHPMHLHGHTFWVTGNEAGRIPETAWVPGNNVLVGVAQARDIEFVANNPGDWILHCHMFHHMMNHMTTMAGPMNSHGKGMPAGGDMAAGMGMLKRGPALSEEHGPAMGRGLGEQTGTDRGMKTGSGHGGHGKGEDPGYKVPGYPQDMMDMMGMRPPEQLKKINKPETRGMRRDWHMIEALHTVIRVLPPDLYDRVVSGKGEVKPGESVPGGGTGMPGMPGHGAHKP